MHQRPLLMNKANMVAATEWAKRHVQHVLDRAREIAEDTRKEERLKRHECKACFYSSRIGGAAMTTRPCMCCGKELMHSSTATDVLCLDCARQHSLCKHCGGDLEMRAGRRNWPIPDDRGHGGAE